MLMIPPRKHSAGAVDTFGRLLLLFTFCCLRIAPSLMGATADYPGPRAGDFVLHDFRFRSGETFPELKMHFLTFGTPHTNQAGTVDNAVLILHGTTGNGSNFVRAEFAGELFGQGQLLDATRYFLVLPDSIGHGRSSKPSDGLHGRFPHYGYGD